MKQSLIPSVSRHLCWNKICRLCRTNSSVYFSHQLHFEEPSSVAKARTDKHVEQVQIVERAKQNVSNNTGFAFNFLTVIPVFTSVTFKVDKWQILPRHAAACAQHIATNPLSDLGPLAHLSRLISGFAELPSCALHLTSCVAFALFLSLSEQYWESRNGALMDGVRWFLSASALNNWCLDCLGIHGHKKAFPSLCPTHCRNLKSSSPVAQRSGKQVMWLVCSRCFSSFVTLICLY